MRLIKRLLGCHDPRRRHLESCDECRQQLRRERQYLERLRGAEVPSASDDLTARLLARTEELARSRKRQAQDGRPHRLSRGRCPRLPSRRAGRGAGGRRRGSRCRPARRLGLRDGRGRRPAGGRHAGLSIPAADLAASGAGCRQAGAGTPAGWSLTGEPDFTPAGALTAAQLAALRSEGWTCPELRELGYHLVWARGGVLAGVDIVELRLTDGQNSPPSSNSTVDCPGSPARRRARPRAAAAGQRAHGPSRDVGRIHRCDSPGGDAHGRRAEPGGRTGNGILWVNHGPPYAAIYQTDDATFTYVSDQPAEQADDGVAALVHTGSRAAGRPAAAAGTASGAGHNFTARLERGLGRIMELLAP